MIVLADTHSYHWWLSEPERLSPAAGLALGAAEEIVVAAITWYELAWLATKGRVAFVGSLAGWLQRIASEVRTIGLTPAIAGSAVALPETFSRDPADRIIFATAMEHGWPIVTKDASMHAHAHLTQGVIW
jgi:PIN domain nuclease of toxin-antitoxin system